MSSSIISHTRTESPNPMLKRAFSLPITQTAWREERRGPPTHCLEQKKVPVMHDLAPGELLVKVEAAALNPVGYKLMQMLPNTLAKRPHTAESDFTGIVVATQGTTGFSQGEPVCGWISQSMSQITSQGALCEYVRVRGDHVIHRPENLTPVQAAGVCLAGLSAYQLLVHDAKVKKGDRILINNGSGGVGTFAIQIAKALGCHVTSSASSSSAEFVRKVGADQIIDYQVEPLSQSLANSPPLVPFDAVIDCYGLDSNFYGNSDKYLKADGVFASVAPATGSLLATASAGAHLFSQAWKPAWLGGNTRKFSLLNLQNSKEDLRALQALIASGKVIPVVDSVYKFDDALLAYDKLMSGRAKGKVVVVINAELYLESKASPS
ncbi:hypothetical protein M408DRAFT_68560 [Serendipita vermifera MAFF 305830]|uniref:Enoyl reductase (ER) domain-containing protein n=1 Tax=Serendipita vermifera MAFF 305830 TaxID=933852 RepID=A0A0C3AWQ7_SERVB|nr:hypothetical protein M408DRAFT_68560 [Serendipita vermifera MAFF 305830]